MPDSNEKGAGTAGNKRPRSDDADGDEAAPQQEIPDNASVPKPKRLACMICRKRKLKCDGVRPSCSTCSRLGHTCAYDEQRRKSGPKRGYVKALEERLSEPLPDTLSTIGFTDVLRLYRTSRNLAENPGASAEYPKEHQCHNVRTTSDSIPCES